jgi:hypothetical protein
MFTEDGTKVLGDRVRRLHNGPVEAHDAPILSEEPGEARGVASVPPVQERAVERLELVVSVHGGRR